jgi:hypothetical protein
VCQYGPQLLDFADREELASIESGNYISNDIPCTESKCKPETKRRCPKNEAGHNSDHLCVNLQLTYRHHRDEKDNQAETKFPQCRGRIQSPAFSGLALPSVL